MSFEAIQYAWWQSSVAGVDRCILAAMAEYCDEEGECYGSAGHLAKKTGFSRRTVQRSLAALAEAGEIVQREKGGFTSDGKPVANGWVLPNVNKSERRPLRHADVSLTSGCRKPLRHADALVIHKEYKEEDKSPQAAPVTVEASPQPAKQNPSLPLSSGEAKLKIVPKPEKALVKSDQPLPHGAKFAHAWAEWVQFRKEIKKVMPPSTVAKQLKAMAALSEADACDCIARSVTNGWQGLFPDKYESKGKPQGKTIAPQVSDAFAEEMAMFRAIGQQ
jgi:hypothetical protein